MELETVRARPMAPLRVRPEPVRAEPMTLITPLSRFSSWRVKVTWFGTRWLLRVTAKIFPLGIFPFGRLRKLSFIHFAHWSVFDRVPPNRPDARKLCHPYMVFQTNFNRGWREYVEAFCLVVAWGMRLNWGWSYGFPDPTPVGPFIRYVEKRFTPCAHFYCAYPDDSTRMVISALDARTKFNTFASEGSGPPPFLLQRRERGAGPKLLGKWWRETDTLSVLCPVTPREERNLLDTLQGFDKQHSPMERVRWTHMARWSVVKPLPFKRTMKALDPTSFLIFVSWFDGDTSAYIEALREGLGDLADAIWFHCDNYPGRRDPGKFHDYMQDHRLKPGLAFAGYQDWVMDVRASLELRHLLTGPVVAAARKDSRTLEEDWFERPRPLVS